ncbi:MAG TPA: ribonuclease HII [Nitrospirae bacterium]|nr:ribonuclease HII [bacterium BMS3Abin06]HDH13643.1 ribonuclease HII [Nitrospirota bacterium]HDZ00901.1 ribonuclease HII [Nitrospirota bacterium]
MSSRNSPLNENTPTIFLNDENLRRKYRVIAGIDEAGRGPLAGPVVAAAVILLPGIVIRGLRDSKKTPEKERKKIFWEIVRTAGAVGVGIVESTTIDRINILQSTRRAMKFAVEDLGTKPDILFIDAVALPDVDLEQKSVIRGESVSASIAAASIIAKVVRDDIMLDYHKKYPGYNFKGHKGYPTKEHIECIKLYGPCPIHRKSFRKVMDVPLPLDSV